MGDNKTTTSGSSQPWTAAQPALKTGLADAQSLYKSGIGSAVNTGSMVTPWSNQSMQAFGDIENKANQYGGYMGGSIDKLQNMAGGGSNPFMSKMASGDFLDGRNNPAFADVLRQTQDDTYDRVNMSAAAAGRYGSGDHMGNVASEIGDVTGRMRAGQYQNEVGNMFNANQMQTNNMYGAVDRLPGAFQAALAPAQAMQGVGAGYEDLYTRQLNDQARVFDAQQNAPWNQLGRLNAIAGGFGSLGNSSTGTSSKPFDWAGTAGNIALGMM